MSPEEIAASLGPDVRAALLEAEGEGRTLPDPEVAAELVALGLFGPSDLSFILEVTDLGRAVAKECCDHE